MHQQVYIIIDILDALFVCCARSWVSKYISFDLDSTDCYDVQNSLLQHPVESIQVQLETRITLSAHLQSSHTVQSAYLQHRR